MRKRLGAWWFDWQESLWLLPTVLALAAALLAIGLVRLDEQLEIAPRARHAWAFGGGASGARGVLQAIAGSVITVTGTVFSITIVALQLAASQMTPRVLRTFTRDRGVQLVLGVFVGTFVYALLVLRTVRSEDEELGPAFVPAVSVTVAIVLALINIGVLIYYVHHVARLIQVSAVIDRVVVDTVGLVDERFPESAGEPAWGADLALLLGPPARIAAETSGYLDTVAPGALFALEVEGPTTIRLEPSVGAHVLAGATLALVWPATACNQELAAAVRGACLLSEQRTLAEDVDLGVRQLADIGVKALSPGINDPTTATICIDRLAEVLARAGRRADPELVRRQDGSRVSLILPAPAFRDLVGTAYAQIRHYGAADALVMARLLEQLGRLVEAVPEARREPLRREAVLALEGARGAITVSGDRERVEAAAGWLERSPEGSAGGVGEDSRDGAAE